LLVFNFYICPQKILNYHRLLMFTKLRYPRNRIVPCIHQDTSLLWHMLMSATCFQVLWRLLTFLWQALDYRHMRRESWHLLQHDHNSRTQNDLLLNGEILKTFLNKGQSKFWKFSKRRGSGYYIPGNVRVRFHLFVNSKLRW
jgi:hypothetical protein